MSMASGIGSSGSWRRSRLFYTKTEYVVILMMMMMNDQFLNYLAE